MNLINTSNIRLHRILNCNNVYIRDVDVFGYRQNSDAFDICNSRDVTVEGCFARTGDDGFVVITPDNTALDLVVYVLCQLVYSLGLGIYSTVSWAMMGDAIDYNEWKTGKREEGMVYSLHSFFRKLAQGVGPAVALVIMASLGYVNNDINDAGEAYINVEKFIGTDVPLNMRVLVAVLFLVAAVMQFIGLALIYNLDKKTLTRMNEELDERHSTDAEAVEQ